MVKEVALEAGFGELTGEGSIAGRGVGGRQALGAESSERKRRESLMDVLDCRRAESRLGK